MQKSTEVIESTQTQSTLQSNEVVEKIHIDELPTNPELAAQGVRDYGMFINAINSEYLQRDLAFEEDIRRCFTGVAPEDGSSAQSFLSSLSSEEMEVVRNALSVTQGRFQLMTHTNEVQGIMVKTVSVLNIPAIRRVMQNYPQYFPANSTEDPYNWLKENYDSWTGQDSLSHIRHGLLSGFPLGSVEKFPIYDNVIRRIIPEDMDYHKEMLVRNYLRKKVPEVALDGLDRKDEILQREKQVDEKSRNIVSQYDYIFGKAVAGYIGFDKKRDQQYLQILDEVYERSGIDTVANNILKKNEGRKIKKIISKLQNMPRPKVNI